MNNLEKMREKARDPNTPLPTLQAIASDYPALRPALALNPSTYPDLLDWLRELGDPEIDAALTQRAENERNRRQHQVAPSVAAVEMPPTPAAGIASGARAISAARDDSHSVPQSSRKSVAAREEAEFSPRLPVGSATDTVSRRRSFLVMWLLLGLVAAAIVIGVIVTNLNGGKPNGSASIPVDGPTPITTGQVAAKIPASSAKAVTELPPGYTGPVKTIEVPGAVPGQTIHKVVPDPEAAQKTTAASATPSATTTSSTPSPSVTPTNRLAAPDNAKASRSFTTADGNVRCVFASGQVQCFANSLQAATNCETRQNDTGYTLVLSGANTLSADCVAPQNTPTETTLKANEAAQNGRFACKSSPRGDAVMCWDTTDGDGFVIGKSTIRRFGTGSKLPEFPR